MAVACAGNANADATLLQPSHTRTQQASGHPKQFCQEGMGTAAPKSILHVVRALPYVTLTPPPPRARRAELQPAGCGQPHSDAPYVRCGCTRLQARAA
jgi:hypothetical protein